MAICVVGGGSFAKKVGSILTEQGIDCWFVDEQATEVLPGIPVFRVCALPRGGHRFLLAISLPEYANQALARLQHAGYLRDSCLPMEMDSCAIVLEQMLQQDNSRVMQMLAQPLGSFAQFERAFFAEQYQALASRLAGASSRVGIFALGRGGGYTEHLGQIPALLDEFCSLQYFTDSQSDKPAEQYFLMSQASMMQLTDIDLAISAHVFDCNASSTAKLSFPHMVYDFLLFSEQTYQHLGSADVHYVFVPSPASFAMHKQLCASLKLTNEVVLIPGGYPRHDKNLREFTRLYGDTQPTRTIIYAPTLCSLLAGNEIDASYSIIEALTFIPAMLAQSDDVQLVFRPHPEDLALVKFQLDSPRAIAFRQLLDFVQAHPRCSLDTDKHNYLHSFATAATLITDTSSVALSFSLLTGRPAIFYSADHQRLYDFYGDCQFLQDRQQFGHCVDNTEALLARVHAALGSPTDSHSLMPVFEQLIFNLGHSEAYALDAVRSILAGERRADWWYWSEHRGH